MKKHEEVIHYQNLKRKMIKKCDVLNYKWAGYYANLLGIGGANPEQVIRNYFNDDSKRFNPEQLSTIYNDLEAHHNIKAFTQCEIQNEVLKFMTQIGKVSEKIRESFDNDDVITLEEITPIMPLGRKMSELVEEFVLRLEETKAQG